MQSRLYKLAVFSAMAIQINNAKAENPFFPEYPIQVSSEIMNSQKGSIKGIIIDQKTKEPLTGATVQIDGTTTGTVADLDGNFILESLSSGRYKLLVKYIA